MVFRPVCFSIVIFLAAGSVLGADSWPWRPFERIRRPDLPTVSNVAAARNEIDAFILAEQEAHGVRMRSEAPKDILLRRVYLDLIGLAPTPSERAAFLADTSPDAYEKVVDRLLADPRHAERWARHWMDVWRYSDWAGWTDGKQIRDSQPHIWRWRDWIVESLEADKPYDRMVQEMLAADELVPEDLSALRATGFLARNYKMLSREQWLEDTIKHTGQAIMGLTTGCAKCHDHKKDPLTQVEYYALRAIFEPHQVRLDQVPGQPDTTLDGLPRVYDANLESPTFFLPRGDERDPDKTKLLAPGVPSFLGGAFTVQPVSLPYASFHPLRSELARANLLSAAEKFSNLAAGENAVAAADEKATPHRKYEVHLAAQAAAAKLDALQSLCAVERMEEAGAKESAAWKEAAARTARLQHLARFAEAKLIAQQAETKEFELRMLAVQARLAAAAALKVKAPEAADKRKAAETAAKVLAEAEGKAMVARQSRTTAEAATSAPATSAYTPREEAKYPDKSSGRRLAFAKWLTAPDHPLTARVAVNHVWCRHFGQGLVPNPADFGGSGRPATHPALVDWLASELVSQDWKLKPLHRLMVLSATYRQSSVSGPDDCSSKDPDNVFLWHFAPRRLEAEAVRDNLLWVTGGLDLTRGGPEIDQNLALTSTRRSLYLRCAQEKQPEFLQIFDGPSVVECYERKPSVIPQQALALLNSELAQKRAKALADSLSVEADSASFITASYLKVLGRNSSPDEQLLCSEFLARPDTNQLRQRELFILTLLNHHEFLTIR